MPSLVEYSRKNELIEDVLQFISENRVFDLMSYEKDGDSFELTLCNLGKVFYTNKTLTFFEKDYLGFWQKVPFLKAQMRVLNALGTPLIDSPEIESPLFIKEWVDELVFEIIRHIVEQFFSANNSESTTYEYFLIKEIVRNIRESNLFQDQQLLSKNFGYTTKVVRDFLQIIKETLLDDPLTKRVAEIREHVTVFELTFSLPNKEKFLKYGQNWANLLPSLAKNQSECLLLSKSGCYDEGCSDWVEDVDPLTEWESQVPSQLQEYIKYIPLQSLRVLMGRNVTHSLSIMQLANIPPTAPIGIFAYVGKVFNDKDISVDKHSMYAECLSHVMDYISDKLLSGYNTVLEVCYSTKLFELLLTYYDGNIASGDQMVKKAFESMSVNIAESIQDDFEKLVAEGCPIYIMDGGLQTDYFAVVRTPKNNFEFKLHEKCLFLIDEPDNYNVDLEQLEWWYVHVSDSYRALIGKIKDGQVYGVYSMKGKLSNTEIAAMLKVINKTK